jgi:hypothetical protein
MIHPSVPCLLFCVMDVHAFVFLGNAQCGVQMQIASTARQGANCMTSNLGQVSLVNIGFPFILVASYRKALSSYCSCHHFFPCSFDAVAWDNDSAWDKCYPLLRVCVLKGF